MSKIFIDENGNRFVVSSEASLADWPNCTEEVDPAAISKEQQVRNSRNIMLAQTDWWASSDLTMTSEQIAYRQAWRDITEQEGFPDSITWPTIPE
jgi:hypothetical protein